jgi:hypothetical protein
MQTKQEMIYCLTASSVTGFFFLRFCFFFGEASGVRLPPQNKGSFRSIPELSAADDSVSDCVLSPDSECRLVRRELNSLGEMGRLSGITIAS